jgi:uncharacterized protein (DUF2062 family)
MVKELWQKVVNKINNIFKGALDSGLSPSKMALSVCVGLYIAFSPFPGGHTIMMLVAGWLWGLNFPILFLAVSINNPWTMIPFFTFDYFFGYWLLHSFFGCHSLWELSLAKIFGSGKICMFSFLIGGNVLGIAVALISYPIMKFIFTKIERKRRMQRAANLKR